MADEKSRDFFGSDVHGVDHAGCSRKELDRDGCNPYISKDGNGSMGCVGTDVRVGRGNPESRATIV